MSIICEFFEDEAIQEILALLLVIIILGVFGWLKFKRDQQTAAKILKNFGIETETAHNPKRSLFTASNPAKSNIKKCCSKNTRQRRNLKEK